MAYIDFDGRQYIDVAQESNTLNGAAFPGTSFLISLSLSILYCKMGIKELLCLNEFVSETLRRVLGT